MTSFRRHLESGGTDIDLTVPVARCRSVLRTRTYFCWLGGRRDALVVGTGQVDGIKRTPRKFGLGLPENGGVKKCQPQLWGKSVR
jgi:hypothetical protein